MMRLVLLCLIVLLSGCASLGLPGADAEPDGERAAGTQNPGETPVIGTLPPQRLEADECGLFLWSRDGRRRLVYVGRPALGEARMVIGGDQVLLIRTALSGTTVLGQSSEESYSVDGLSMTVGLRLVLGRDGAVSGGAVVPQGTISLIGEDGWRTVLPVGGLIACQR